MQELKSFTIDSKSIVGEEEEKKTMTLCLIRRRLVYGS
jgi:hypothetical protein